MSLLSTVIGNFSILRIRNFRIYLSGQSVSLIGTWLQVAAQSWVVWRLTGSTESLGVIGALNALPSLLLGPWVGTWADRSDRRKLLIGTQIAAMLLAFIAGYLVISNMVQIWHLYVLSLTLGVVTALDGPTQTAFLGDLAGVKEVRSAINLNFMVFQLSRIIGPGIAGAAIARIGEGPAFVLNGLSFMVVIGCLLVVRTAGVVTTMKIKGGALQGFGNALKFVGSQPRLIDTIFIAMMVMFFGISIILNMLPAVASKMLSGDASTLGILMAASGAGSLVGTIVVAPWIQSLRRTGAVLPMAMCLASASLLLLASTNVLGIAMLALFLAGLVIPPVMMTVMGLLQFNAPPQMRARVAGLFMMVNFGLQPLAALWIGWSAERLGLPTAIALNSAGLFIGALVMLSRGPLRRWEAIPQMTEPHMAEPSIAAGD